MLPDSGAVRREIYNLAMANLIRECRGGVTGVLIFKMAALCMSKVVAIVTGGASGLGRATAARLARHGASVLIADLPESNGHSVAKEIGGDTMFVPTNVSKSASVK